MLLQGSQSARGQGQSVPARDEPRITVTVTPNQQPEAPAYVPRRSYAPISWETPSLGRSVASGLGGISRTMVLLIVAAAGLVGIAIAIAIAITSAIGGLGIDASINY